jgi:hypothetical protein
MIDENSHYSQPAEAGESNLFSLRKRAPIESLFNFHQTCIQLPFARTSPSTFLFLLSSQCQRADPGNLAASTSCESSRFQKSSHKTNPSPVARKPVRLCQKHQNSGSEPRSTSSSGRVLDKSNRTVNTLFSITVRFQIASKPPGGRSFCSQQQLLRLPGRAVALSESADQWELLRSTSFNEAGSRIGTGMCQRPGQSFCLRGRFSAASPCRPVDNATSQVV